MSKNKPDFSVSIWLLIALMYVVQTWFVKGNAFFWDTVQFGSLHAHWYYENQFRYFLLPDEWDSGHPPFFGMYIAFCWKLFGKSLPVSHFAMLPFLLLTAWQMLRLSQKISNHTQQQIFIVLILLLNPVWAAQSTLISPDVILGGCLLGGINAILNRKKWALMCFVIGLSLISNRGLIVSAGLYFGAYFYWQGLRPGLKRAINTMLPFLVGWSISFLYLAYHYYAKGWIGYYADSSWNESFARVNLMGFLRNIAILGWRLVDFGHLILWLIFGVLLLSKKMKDRLIADQTWLYFFITGIVLLVLFSMTVLPYRGLLGHRYFLPLYWLLSILVYKAVLLIWNGLRYRVAVALMIAGLLTGTAWVYPQPIATGWDSTLAHLPYFALRTKMIEYMSKHHIPFEKTGTSFPNLKDSRYIDLSETAVTFAEKDLNKNDYIFYSNIMNDFSKEDLYQLNDKWQVVKTFQSGFVVVKLYQK